MAAMGGHRARRSGLAGTRSRSASHRTAGTGGRRHAVTKDRWPGGADIWRGLPAVRGSKIAGAITVVGLAICVVIAVVVVLSGRGHSAGRDSGGPITQTSLTRPSSPGQRTPGGGHSV